MSCANCVNCISGTTICERCAATFYLTGGTCAPIPIPGCKGDGVSLGTAVCTFTLNYVVIAPSASPAKIAMIQGTPVSASLTDTAGKYKFAVTMQLPLQAYAQLQQTYTEV
jgi:hypothetical protein